MFKDRVENDRKFFEMPTHLSCEQGNSSEKGAGKFKIYVILNFPTLDFLVRKIKERELKFFFVVLYHIFIHTHICSHDDDIR